MINIRKIILVLLVLLLLAVTHERILSAIGSFLVVRDIPEKAEAAVVLYTGVDIYPRLMEAADLYRQEKVDRVVINGNRKTDILRNLEQHGFESPCKWYAEKLEILIHLGVSKEHIMAISAENVFDTISEADTVGKILVNNGLEDIIITTSKFHSRRALHIWHTMYQPEIQVYSAPARNDPYNPEAWWKNARQVRWVLAEYGAWLYYYWVKLLN